MDFFGHPLMAYTISVANESGLFDSVVLCTDSERYAEIGNHYGAENSLLRPVEISGSTSPDLEWIEYAMDHLRGQGREYECFCILRPTSPFRSVEMLKRAWSHFLENVRTDSIRAVEKCTQHPGKMWMIRGDNMVPLMPFNNENERWHNSQFAALPEVYVQNASLEIAWTHTVLKDRSISGSIVAPFLTEGHEGFDINQPEDVWYAKHLVENGSACLPEIGIESFFGSLS
jgi:CMP-N,N'-diacetyllegionaminic acid synthase